MSGGLTPWLSEALARLGAWVPFEQAARLLECLTGVRVSEATVRRQTEEAGAYLLAVETEEAERIEEEAPASPAGPAKQCLSADGAYVPLVGGEWQEVRTLVLGTVNLSAHGEAEVGDLSYFSRLVNAQTFARLAHRECHRRGVERAGECCLVSDGAEWIQGLVDLHRPDAVRILDFPHAAERVSGAAKAYFGEGSPRIAAFLAEELHALKHEGPARALQTLPRMASERPDASVIADNLAYLRTREAMMQYPAFQEAGWPIGSGAVESANKLVVEARMKGAGMHWAPAHVNPLLALRNAVANDRWDEASEHVVARKQEEKLWRKLARIERQAPPPPPPAVPKTTDPKAPAKPSATGPRPVEQVRRPAANHPWRHSPIGKARFQPKTGPINAKN